MQVKKDNKFVSKKIANSVYAVDGWRLRIDRASSMQRKKDGDKDLYDWKNE